MVITKSLVCATIPTLLLQGISFGTWAKGEQICSSNQLAAIKTRLPSNTELTASACKTLPNQPEVTLISYIFPNNGEHNDDMSLPISLWRVELISQGKVRQQFEELIEEDASIRIGSSSIWLDTAPYLLAKGERAFGVRLDIGYGPSCADGYRSRFLHLFRQHNRTLQRVMNGAPMLHTYIRKGVPCLPEKIDLEQGISYIQVLPNMSNGLHDLKVVTKAKTETHNPDGSSRPVSQRTLSTTLRFNGHEYPIGEWNNLPSKEWWK
ncbi:hypothetical protein MM182_14320 [Aeromonas sp. MR19]|uniref:Uncharacterized protein n=1 Tax=Aeromonas bestiarum TaxID=105751 RepID=A0AAW7I084_9GAMM|nr:MULTISPECIES: hypothetical protein [Aeromonas]MCH7376537.1 hypothetical protein [Aeromonas sp. MR19]MDM5141571.1 hypothetical protein [Aeromonas bestiarum]